MDLSSEEDCRLRYVTDEGSKVFKELVLERGSLSGGNTSKHFESRDPIVVKRARSRSSSRF